MAQQLIGVGTNPNDGTGDKVRAAFIKINTMFGELYPTLNGASVPLTGKFFSDDSPAATISRLGDRAFIGAAVTQNGAAVPNRTWAGLEANGYMTYLDTRSSVESVSTIGGVSIGAATRASDIPTGMTVPSIGFVGLAKNDVVSATAGNRKSAWSFYAIAARSADAAGAIAGSTQAVEFEIANMGGVVDVNPYVSMNSTSGVTYAAILGAGGEYAQSGIACNAVTAALHISGGNGGTAFRKGINFTSNAIDGANGTTGTGIALSMALGHEITWFYSGSDTARGLTIRSDCNTINYAMKMVASATGLRFYDQFDNTVVRILPAQLVSGDGQNSLILTNSKVATGNPYIQGTGSDSAVGVDLVGQGKAQFNIYNQAKVRLIARFLDAGTLATSASNLITLNANDSTADPFIAPIGSGTNVSVAIIGKGTGGFIAKDGASAAKFQCNTTGIAFFNATPVAKPTLPAALSTGGSETNVNIATAINAIRTALINYGLAA